MELELSRVDYTVTSVTSKNCMKLLPKRDQGEQQKVVVADNEGILQVFSIKKEDVVIHFKTLPGPKISCMQLAGADGTPSDKIFVASENEVRGYTEKGKLFLSFDTNLTEPISSMFVLGKDLFICGKHIYNHYRDCKDVGSYLCGDSIVDVVALYSNKARRLISLLACEGRMIRAIEHSRVTMTMEVASAPTVLHILELNNVKHVLFGTMDGRVGLLDIERTQEFNKWVVHKERFSSGITSICSYDFFKDGVINLVLGRDDGNVEVYVINLDDEDSTASLMYFVNCIESITSVQCGTVGEPTFDEILVATYTGRIIGLTSQIMDKNIPAYNINSSDHYASDTNQKIIKLKDKIQDLQAKVNREREKHRSLTQSFLDDYSTVPLLTLKCCMILSQKEASYTVSIETPKPIDNVLLQTDVPVNILDVEKNSAVVSFCESDPKNDNFCLATYRCQVNTNRVDMKVCTIEGQYGTLRAYVTALTQPKYCRLVKFKVKALSLHFRSYNFDDSRPYNNLTIKGPFSLAEIHTWVYQCIPEVPEKCQVSERTELVFQSSLADTLLKCTYSKGQAEFQSDNLSTIAVIKDFISKETTKKKIRIDLSIKVNDESIKHILKLIDPKLKSYITLLKNISLLDGLYELNVKNEATIECLSPKYRDLLEKEKYIRAEYTEQPSYLDRLYGIITDLFIDYYKLKGINAKSKIPRLIEILDNYKFEDLLESFQLEHN